MKPDINKVREHVMIYEVFTELPMSGDDYNFLSMNTVSDDNDDWVLCEKYQDYDINSKELIHEIDSLVDMVLASYDL